MAGLLLAGCLFVAYGPAVVLLIGLILKKSYLFIVTITSAFVWLLALLAAAIAWYAIPPLRTVHPFNIAVTVVIEELVRFLFIRLFIKSEARMGHTLPAALRTLNDFTFSISAGLGFSLMQNVIMYGAVIGSAGHESIVYLDTCTTIPLPVLDAILALLLFLSHELLMVLAMDAARRRTKLRLATVPVIHMIISQLTLLSKTDSGCQGMLPLIASVVIVTGLWTVHVLRSTSYAGKIQAAASQHPDGEAQSSSGSSPRRPLVHRPKDVEMTERRRK